MHEIIHFALNQKIKLLETSFLVEIFFVAFLTIFMKKKSGILLNFLCISLFYEFLMYFFVFRPFVFVIFFRKIYHRTFFKHNYAKVN